MSTVKPMTIAVIRTTGEKVFVVKLSDDGHAYIRRPVISEENGISHDFSSVFFAEELVTLEGYAESQIAEMLLRAKYQKKLDAALGEGDEIEVTVVPPASSDPSVN